MNIHQIILDFGTVAMEASLLDTSVAKKFFEHLPYTVNLQGWGKELYGSIGVDLGVEDPVSIIPSGGIAYSTQGNYVCIFFGQTPAWPVEYIGQIEGEAWKKLKDSPALSSVTINKK